MSAPTPAPGDDRPREGYYPDPSIPGYVRYWNGASWVPGTSRPAPKDGERLTPPPGVQPAVPSVEETGPHFFDEDPAETGPQDGAGLPGQAGLPAQAGQADRWAPAARPGQAAQGAQWGRPGGSGPAGRQDRSSGSGGDAGRGGAWGVDPRVPAEPADGRDTGRTDGTASNPPAQDDGAPDPGTFIFRRPIPGPAAARTDDGTMTFRPVPPGPTGSEGGASGGSGAAGFGTQGPVGAPANPGFGAGKAAAARAGAAQPPHTPATPQAPGTTPQTSAPQHSQAPSATAPSVPQQAGPAQAGPAGPGQAGPAQAGVPQAGVPQPGAAQAVPGQSGTSATPLTAGPGGGQASWAQQVHQLAGGGDEQPVAPWKPPVEDLFQAAARRQAAARPAGLGKRLAARLIDSLAVGAVTAAAAVPLGTRALDHVQEKIDAARLSGREVTVWLLDGTTGTSLGIVLAVLLLAGVLYEVLPTVKWGRTLGKKLCGLEVRDIEAHEPPTFGPALRRWLVFSVPGLLAVGIVGVLWCLFDRPWRQCWHDKAAHTFVAG
ncbi:RDD family protein [Streptomyces sp. SP2-10]|uniref:RDD family protein n=1 Tax=Streptomyces sp. SP2-10 TaxID=2873385 RepID=UPI001CA75710|nr:RDD family protein [Streptomyces sp. SP2-10]MBY8844025.1 RDD family protein [Streptomyces sp. SP2-10]